MVSTVLFVASFIILGVLFVKVYRDARRDGWDSPNPDPVAIRIFLAIALVLALIGSVVSP